MSDKIILVTGVGGDIGQGIIKCLKDAAQDCVLLGCDIDPYAAGRKGVEKFFISPQASNPQEYLNFVDDLIDKEGISYILPSTEPEIEFYDTYRTHFSRKLTELIINNPIIIKTFLDKYETTNFLKQNNLPHPKTFLLEKYNNELGFPIILKPRKSWGGKRQTTISSEEELLFFKMRNKDNIIQEIVGSPDEEYTVGVFSTGKKIYSIAFKRLLGYGSLTKVAQYVYDLKLRNLAERIAELSSLKGSLNLQVRKAGSGYIPLEINPRFSSTVYIRHCFGFQDVKWWIDLKNGRDAEYIPKFKAGTAVRTIGEVFFELEPF